MSRIRSGAHLPVSQFLAFVVCPAGRKPSRRSPLPINRPHKPAPLADPASSHFTSGRRIAAGHDQADGAGRLRAGDSHPAGSAAKDTDSERAQAAKGWRVFKAAETDAKGNIVFIHVMMPALRELRLPAVVVARRRS